MQYYHPTTEKDLEEYVDALGDIYRTKAVTDLAIKSYFLTTAVLAKETAKKLALID